MLVWLSLLCLVLVVASKPDHIDLLHDFQSPGPLHISGENICQGDFQTSKYHEKHVLSAKIGSFGLFSGSKMLWLHATLAISCEEKTTYTLLTLADWDISVDCSTPKRILFGQDSFPVQEDLIHSLRLFVTDSRFATLQVDGSFSKSSVESLGLTEDTFLVIAPNRDISGNISLHTLNLTRGSANKGEDEIALNTDNIHAEVNFTPFVRVNEMVKIAILFRDNSTGIQIKDHDSLKYKISISGVRDDSIHCKDLQCTATVPVAGIFSCILRYSIDGKSFQASQDIIVRKHGDDQSEIEVQLSSLFNANGLRPLDRTTYRSQFGLTIARDLGWSEEYYFGNDSVSERLFDYRILDNGNQRKILNVFRCEDAFLAGGPRIRLPGDPQGHGHSKRVLFVPMKYPETTDSSHFSIKRRKIEEIINKNASAYGCSKSEVENLIQYTGMFDMVNHQLIRDSYGHLSLHLNPQVSEEITIGKFESECPSTSPYSMLSQSLNLAASSQPKELGEEMQPYWALVALSPFPLRPHMPSFKVWYSPPKDIFITSACSISTYHMIHEIYHMLGYHHPYQYRVHRHEENIISPLDESGSWVRDIQYQESFDVLGCCSGDASLSTRILNGWVNWEESRVEIFRRQGPADVIKKNLILYPFDSPEVSHGRSHLGIAMRLNESCIIMCGYRDLVRWPISFDDGQGSLVTRQNILGLECEVLHSGWGQTGDWNNFTRATLDFSLLKESMYHYYTKGDFHQRKIFSLLGEQMAFVVPDQLLLIHKGLVPCNGTVPPEDLIEHFMGLEDDYPFQETFTKRATYSMKSHCAAIHFANFWDEKKNSQDVMSIQFFVSQDEKGESYLNIQWDFQEARMAGISLKTNDNQTIKSFISPNELQPINPPLNVLWLSDPCLQEQEMNRIDMIDYTGRSSSSKISHSRKSHKIDISSRFSNNYDWVTVGAQHSLSTPRIPERNCPRQMPGSGEKYISRNIIAIHCIVTAVYLYL